MIKTGDRPPVDEWVNNIWPDSAKEAIKEHIQNYSEVVKFRTSAGNPSIRTPIGENCQIIINYNSERGCFVVWNAAIQSAIHKGKSIQPSLGKKIREDIFHSIKPDSIIPEYQEIGRGGSGKVELVLIVGIDAFPDFCEHYRERIRPDMREIPEGKICLYADAGGEIQELRRR